MIRLEEKSGRIFYGCMIVVSDTTPLISLLKINCINLLERLFGEVMIPQAEMLLSRLKD